MSSVIVVEGIHDMERIKRLYPEIMVVTTNGSEISNDTLNLISSLSKTNDIICLLDPDHPGERIRNRIKEIVPNCYHAFIKKELCISHNHKKVGIEHANDEDIINALNHIMITPNLKNHICNNDLYDLGIINNKNLRLYISNHYNIGNPNNKTFLNRINMIEVTLEDLRKLVGEYYERENRNN